MREINITKEEFCKVMDKIQKTWEWECKIDDALGAVIDMPDLSDVVIDLLNKLLGIEYDEHDPIDSDISYFCWELDFGKKWTPESLIVDDKSIDISTAENLYDYLISD